MPSWTPDNADGKKIVLRYENNSQNIDFPEVMEVDKEWINRFHVRQVENKDMNVSFSENNAVEWEEAGLGVDYKKINNATAILKFPPQHGEGIGGLSVF